MWNEDPEDTDFTDNAPQDEPIFPLFSDQESHVSRALTTWLLYFLLFVQAVYHISDNALGLFVRFFKVFFSILGHFCKVSAKISEYWPSSLYRVKHWIGSLKFRKYVVCKKCHRIYFFSECILGPENSPSSKTCSFQPFPRHPQQRMRKPCGSVLLKSVEYASGITRLYPRLTYCYLGLEPSLQRLLLLPDFYTDCELWRYRRVEEGVMRDVYDGKIWSDFQSLNGQPFLSDPGNFALMLNLDFFQPYKHVQYSLGAIYLTVLNLPRGVRNKTNNVILVGLIPGPQEPQHDLNSYLEPLVDELQQLWSGRELDVHALGTKRIRCALICIACDLPAGRKVCGFLSHNAHLGCSRCWKKFSGSVGSMDFSGFNRENWRKRTGAEHKHLALSTRFKLTKSARDAAESTSGYRYSVILELPYFDAPLMLVIDPMHNLFLGTAKHFFKSVLMERKILSASQLYILQQRVDSIRAPPDIGRIPGKIGSGFASFTADQWKNWVVYYSLFALHDMLNDDVLECWRHFVQACRVILAKHITVEKVQLSDAHLVQFCKRMQSVFGKHLITPNMHMHCHLRSCVLDFGPLHGFWLYAFERYNGLLGTMPHNNHSIEVQIMNRFLKDKEVFRAELPLDFSDDFLPLFPKQIHATGSLSETLNYKDFFPSAAWTIDSDGLNVTLPPHYTRRVLNETEFCFLQDLYSKLYNVPASVITLCSVCQRYKCVTINSVRFGSHKTHTSTSSIAIATWDNLLFGTSSSLIMPNVLLPTTASRAVQIDFFCKSIVEINGESKTHLLVSLAFKPHPKIYELGKPTTVWYHDLFELHGFHSIIPVQFLTSRAVSLIEQLDNESVLFVCPCIDF